MEWNTDRGLAVFGIALATVMLVLDKAGKLKGNLILLVILAFAICMLIPIMWSIPWVANSLGGYQLWTRRLLTLFVLGTVWAGLSVWVTSGHPPKEQEAVTSTTFPSKTLDLSLIPHGENSSDLFLEVINNGETATLTAQLRALSRSYGDGLKSYAYDGIWAPPTSFRMIWRDDRPIHTVGNQSAVRVESGKSRLLRIARMDSNNGDDISRMCLSGLDEWLIWEFERKESSPLPFITVQVDIFGEGFEKFTSKVFKVGPAYAYGPLQMVPVAA